MEDGLCKLCVFLRCSHWHLLSSCVVMTVKVCVCVCVCVRVCVYMCKSACVCVCVYGVCACVVCVCVRERYYSKWRVGPRSRGGGYRIVLFRTELAH